MSMGNPPNAGNSEISNLLVQGFKAAKENRRDEAYGVFCEVVKRDPKNELGWLYRAATTDDLSEAYVCLQRVLDINPNNEKAQRGIERIQTRLDNEEGGTEASNALDDKPAMRPGSIPPPPPPPRPGQMNAGYDFDDDAVPFSRGGPMPPDRAGSVPSRPPTGRDAVSDFSELPDDDEAFDPNTFFGNESGNGGRFPANAKQSARNDFGAEEDDQYQDQDFGDLSEDELVDEPIQDTGMMRNVRGRPVAGQAAKGSTSRGATGRDRRLAEFGRNQITGLNAVGRQRAQNYVLPLQIAGVLLAIIAVGILFFVVVLKPNNNNNDLQTAANATQTAGAGAINGISPDAAITPIIVSPSTGGVSVPVVGDNTPVAGGDTNTPIGVNPTINAAPTQPQVPPTTAVVAPPPTSAPPVGNAPRAVVYVVKPGDSLTKIAKQYSTTIEAVRSANGIPATSSNINAGQSLVVPVSRSDYRGRGAILKDKETLQTLADRFKVTVDSLVRLNGLAGPQDVKAGDAILIG